MGFYSYWPFIVVCVVYFKLADKQCMQNTDSVRFPTVEMKPKCFEMGKIIIIFASILLQQSDAKRSLLFVPVAILRCLRKQSKSP